MTTPSPETDMTPSAVWLDAQLTLGQCQGDYLINPCESTREALREANDRIVELVKAGYGKMAHRYNFYKI